MRKRKEPKMIRRVTAFAAVGVAGLITAAAALSGGSSAATTLRGAVGPGFTISMTKSGKKVTKLKPGTYRLVVSDRSAEHNFVLKRGNSVRQLTSVPFVGTKSVTVKLTKGTWTFFCAPHASAMFGRFGVGAAVARLGTTTTRGEAEPGDDHGGRGEAEPGDDHGGHGETEPGDDHGGHSGHDG
jgi:hypothetical protein